MNRDEGCNLLVILGPTASGKTRLGVQLARLLDGEIISADSRQVYRGMDIGTGKDLAEYGDVPHHLIDIVDPGYEFNVFEFQRRFVDAFIDIGRRCRMPIMVGGTGMYLAAILQGYDLVQVPENPDLRGELAVYSQEQLAERLLRTTIKPHNTTDLRDRDRLVRAIEIAEFRPDDPAEPLPAIRPIVFGVRWERTALRERITTRLRERLESGMIEEVANLHAAGIPYQTLEYYGLEYRYISRHLQGELNPNDLFQKLNSAIHDFAKRQETWFRRMERGGVVIHWLEGTGDLLASALRVLGSDDDRNPG